MRRVLIVVVAAGVVGVLGAVATAAAKQEGAAPTAQSANHRGGTMKLLAKAAGGTLDPQVNYTLQYWNLYMATYDGLLAFTKASGDASFNVVPDIAEKMPTLKNGGKTWTFKIRRGVKFSNGKEVTTADVVASLQRIFKVK